MKALTLWAPWLIAFLLSGEIVAQIKSPSSIIAYKKMVKSETHITLEFSRMAHIYQVVRK